MLRIRNCAFLLVFESTNFSNTNRNIYFVSSNFKILNTPAATEVFLFKKCTPHMFYFRIFEKY